ncbi:MAG TPA: tetratricopeptide repeat protein, partial [Chitinophagaceae bacterium]|nr:tetratricopeptide repeat protein [Chitinophagaceae bacterium]
MKRFLFPFVLLFVCCQGFSQANYFVTDPEKAFKEAKEYFMKGEYSLAYPLLKDLKDQYPENSQSAHAYLNQDVTYYYIVCGLKMNQSVAEDEAHRYIDNANNEPRQQMMSYHLAKYYFTRNDFARAVVFYQRAGYDNLSNEEIADAKFELAYSYFNLKQFDNAKPLFNEIHQLPQNKYYYDANYYYGFICYRDRDYNAALSAFQKVEDRDKYKGIVPYYIAQIYYFEGNKEQALKYGEEALSRRDIYYRNDLDLLTGQLYFEKKDFAKALPYLKNYVDNSDKVSKEVMYELSYCYYDQNQVDKAIEGFKQLSNEQDSMGQNSMYLLGDLYLRTGRKENARNAFLYSANNSSNRKQQEISRFNYAKLSYELGYQDVALTELNKFVDLYPNSEYAPEAKEILISLLANTNNYKEALALYASFGKPTPTMQKVYPRLLFGESTEYINNQQLNDADALLTKIVGDPNAGAVLPYADFWKGEVAYRLGRYDDVIKYMNAYLLSGAGPEGEANADAAKYTLGYAYLQEENYPLALSNFRQVAPSINSQATGIRQDAYVRAADCYFMQKNFSAAKSMYQNVIDNGLPQADYSLYQIALIEGVRSPAEKIKTFNSLVKRYPKSDLIPESYMQIASAYMAEEKFQDAIPYLNNILQVKDASGEYPKVYLKLGLCYYNLSKNEDALKSYQTLVSAYPQSPEADEALDNMKSIYVELGRPNDYVSFVNKAGKVISVSEADSLTYASAELKYNSNDCAGAIDAFNNYLSKYPQGGYALPANFYRSECYSKNKDWKNALQGYDAVVNAGSSKFAEKAAYAAAHICYFETQDYAQALTYFSKLKDLATTPENQLEALRGLVRSYYQTKNYSQANDAARELLTKKGLSTDDRAVANLVLGKSLEAANQYDQAIAA